MNHFFNILRLTFVSAAIFCALQVNISIAAEVIKSFDAKVKIAKDGTLTVTETISVVAEGRKIRRGIYRDFPLLFEDAKGKEREVGFKLLSILRDGKTDSHRIERSRGKVRIYIGNKNVFLKKGEYTYTIQYETTRQIRYFDTHDELFWNVTGNFWDFPIQTSSAEFILPEGASVTDTIGFTGRFGSTEQAVNLSQGSSGRTVKAVTSRALKVREGLSVAIKMPKGSIAPPSSEELNKLWWEDNSAMIMGLIGLALVSLYYFFAWWRVGRDLPRGIIVPRWSVSEDMSPALVNYIDKKGLSGKGFDAISSGFLSLAVKGLVTLEKKTKNLYITATNKTLSNKLPIGEAALLAKVKASNNNVFAVSKSNGSKVKALQQSFSSAMEKEHRGKFYKHNFLWVGLGIFFSIITLIIVFTVGSISEEALAFVLIGGVFTVFISVFIFGFVKQMSSTRDMIGKIVNLVVIGFMTFSFISTGLGVAAGFVLNAAVDPWPIVTVVGVVVLNVLFFFLLGAPTQLGRAKMDEIEGLKTYLTLAEKDRMNMKDAPDFSTAHYEELLPYAVALGVEKPWSKSFETWLAAAVAAGAVAASYNPNWYSGRDFNSDDLSSSMDDFTSSMENGFSSAMPVPKSSSSGFSGGGGGFSGGGGGGGGGGGW